MLQLWCNPITEPSYAPGSFTPFGTHFRTATPPEILRFTMYH